MRDRRRRKLVDNFQYRLIARMVIYWLIYQVTLWNFLFCWRLLQEGKGNLVQQYNQFFHEYYPMLLCFLILVPAFTWDAVKFYHRVAGPIRHFRTVAREIVAERPVRYVSLRQGDELAGMRDDFNAMLDTLARHGGVSLIADPEPSDQNASGADVAVFPCDPGMEDNSHAAG